MGLYVEYRAALISLTAAVAFVGACAAVAACEQFRIAITASNPSARYKLLWLVSFSFGGVCIWGEFYLAMSSFRLHLPSGAIVLKTYDVSLCLSSIVVVNVLTYTGLYIASTDKYFCRSKKEIVEDYRAGLGHQEFSSNTEADSRRFSRANLAAYTQKLEKIVTGALFMSTALVIMRFMGMASMIIPGRIRITTSSIVAHAILAVVGSIGGFWVYFRVLSLFPSWDTLRIACAIEGVLFFTGLQYVALAGAVFEHDPSVEMPGEDQAIPWTRLAVGVIISTVLLAFLVLVYVLFDLRVWLLRTNAQLRQADRALLALLHRPPAERNLHRTTVSPHGTRYTTVIYRHTQAPLEVVNYSRQFLRSVAQLHADSNSNSNSNGSNVNNNASLPTEVFTYKYRLFYDADLELMTAPEGVTDPLQLDQSEQPRQDGTSAAAQEPHNRVRSIAEDIGEVMPPKWEPGAAAVNHSDPLHRAATELIGAELHDYFDNVRLKPLAHSHGASEKITANLRGQEIAPIYGGCHV